jgi:TonB family protein
MLFRAAMQPASWYKSPRAFRFCACTLLAYSLVGAAPSMLGSLGNIQPSIEILTPNEGVDFKAYTTRLESTVKRNWYAIMPESALLGQKGVVSILFHIRQDGTVHAEDPIIETLSGKKALDDAAFEAIRNSAPFEHLPLEFSGPNIKVRIIFFYNLPVDSRKNIPHHPTFQTLTLPK